MLPTPPKKKKERGDKKTRKNRQVKYTHKGKLGANVPS
jgi:hypothetical protein